MSEIGQAVVNRIKNLEYAPNDVDVSFGCMDEYRYLYIHATMSIDTSFAFYLMDDWTNGYFSLPDGNTIDSNQNIVKVYSFNDRITTNNYLNLIYLMFIYTGVLAVLLIAM
jgi:hypothetical protein